jgi:hypothetical protein
VSRPALGPTQPPVQLVPGVLSPGGKARPGRDADHSPPSSAEVENVRAIPPLPTSASVACSGTALVLMSKYYLQFINKNYLRSFLHQGITYYA